MTASYIFESLSGIFATDDAPELLQWLKTSLESGATFLLIDLEHVTHIESSGLGTLMIACNRVRRAGGTLALCSLNPQTQMQVERAGLIDKFDIYDSRREFEHFVLGDDELSHYGF